MVGGDGAFFLDTSTQISKTWEDEKIRQYLNNELSQKPRYSSVYVKNEYKLKILKEAILVHTVIVDSATLDEALSRLDDIMKRLGRGLDELPYKVFRRLFNEYNSKKPFLSKLERIIELTWRNFFMGTLKTTLFNLVECESAKGDPCKNKENHYVPITGKCSDCKIDDFLKTQQSALGVLSNIDNAKLDRMNDPKSTLKRIKAASTTILGGTSPHGKPCKEMSDAVISIEAKASDPTIILHSMDSDFKLLGEVLNIPTCVHSKHEILSAQQPGGGLKVTDP
jgi:hypothetical protein